MEQVHISIFSVSDVVMTSEKNTQQCQRSFRRLWNPDIIAYQLSGFAIKKHMYDLLGLGLID